ncbi:MAG: DUF61 family protein [Candidatus Heimdallarchaeota archaeon]|nr:MAG: DUF61 family protein [Candidatus Heimdallarchaeota archaeon]
MSKKLLEGLWRSEKAKIIASLPKTKKSLTSLLSHPIIELNNGEDSYVEISELELMKQIVPNTLNDQLMLPFTFQKKKSLYYLLGGKLEKWVIEKLLGLTDSSPFLLEVFTPRSSYFVYHFKRIQSRIPTLVFLTFHIDSRS